MLTRTPKKPAIRIRMNPLGNWYGYISGRRVIEFFNTSGATRKQNAEAWQREQEAKRGT